MKQWRRPDDLVILELNDTKQSAETCGDFFKQLSDAWAKRDAAIDYCLK